MDDESEEGSWTITQLLSATVSEAHWEGYVDKSEGSGNDSEKDCEFTKTEDEEELDKDVFNHIMQKASGYPGSAVFDKVKMKYQRGLQASKRTYQRGAKKEKELHAAAGGGKPLTDEFLIRKGENGGAEPVQPQQWISQEQKLLDEHREAILSLEKKLQSKKVSVQGQNLT